MFFRESVEDSYTLDNYIYFIQGQNNSKTEELDGSDQSIDSRQIHINSQQIDINSEQIDIKSEKIHIKSEQIEKKQYFTQRKRKLSTQMSLFSWLVKDKPTQNSLFLSLDKQLILKIYSYLRISQIFIASSVSSYLYSCSKHLWIDPNFFQQFQTDKFTSQQLNKVIEKSKLDHIKQLKQIYLGKNIKKNREKIKMRLTNNNPAKNCILQVFYISPKIKNGAVFIMDSHLSNILNSSHKGLQCIELHRCPYVKNFTTISRCIELRKFLITYNEYVTTENLCPIFKSCLKLQSLEVSECKNLDENIFTELKNIQGLESLTLRLFKQSFGKLALLSACQHLEQLNIDDSLITDDEFLAGIKELKFIKKLSIQGCALLTTVVAEFLLKRLQKKDCSLRQIHIARINSMDCQKIEQIEQKLYKINLEKGPVQK